MNPHDRGGAAAVALLRAEGAAWVFGPGCLRLGPPGRADRPGRPGAGRDRPGRAAPSRARGTRRPSRGRLWHGSTVPADPGGGRPPSRLQDVHLAGRAHAAGIILQHCADTGQAVLGLDSLRLGAAGGPPAARNSWTARRCRQKKPCARSWSRWPSCSRLRRFPAPGHVQPPAPGPARLRLGRRGGAGGGDSGVGPLGLPQPGPRGEYKLPGALGQALLINRSPPPGRPDHRGVHPAARPPRGRWPPAPGNALRAAARGCLARLLRSAGAPRLQPRAGHRGNRSRWVGWVERWHATSPLTPKVRAIIRTIVAKAGRWLAAEHPEITEPGQWTRETCAAWVEPSTGWRSVITCSAATICTAAPGNRSPAHQGSHAHGHPDVLQGLPGMGVAAPPVRPVPGAGRPPQRRRADRHRSPGHRR